MANIQSKIKGALYGFAIGDAMGATTEFMDAESIKSVYGKVTDIMGGGWLNLKSGEVTDDTQMMLCVCDAIEFGLSEKRMWSAHDYKSKEDAVLSKCCDNFIGWYLSNPKDIGNCCARVISTFINHIGQGWEQWVKEADNPQSLGNGSLMRTMPIILSGQSEDLAMLQGMLTHNNTFCDTAISVYYHNMEELLYYNTFRNIATKLYEPTGHVMNTLNNSLYHVQHTDCFEESIINAVNNGGDADTIAAITGSLAGALYGYEDIPKRWIEQLDSDVKNQIDEYAKLFEKINKKVCTNS